jgi:tRNA(Arg) A34 adenosine deaminase TadA
LIDHAETRALLRIGAGEASDLDYDIPSGGPDVTDGSRRIEVFGTLEPCPMCASVLTNAGASRSVSTCRDGRLAHHEVDDQQYTISDGAANVLDLKFHIQPRIWRLIQQGRGLSFQRLESRDTDLRRLSGEIFTATRKQIDEELARRKPRGGGAISEGYAMRSPEGAQRQPDR